MVRDGITAVHLSSGAALTNDWRREKEEVPRRRLPPRLRDAFPTPPSTRMVWYGQLDE